MGRVLLVCRLAARDLRRRPAEAALLLLAITAATTTLTLGLGLRGVTSKPYQSTRAATAGPDVVASVASPPDSGVPADLAGLKALANAPGVVGHSGPYPVVWTKLGAHGHTLDARVEGRETAPAPIDQPKLTQGSWLGGGGVVVEAAFADALGVGAGDPITLNGRSFRVVGVAVTAATAPYPELSCLAFCLPAGLVWLSQADARSLASQEESLAYVLNLKLADPAAAPAFVDEHNPPENAPPGTRASDPAPPLLQSWQDIHEQAATLVRNQRRALLTWSSARHQSLRPGAAPWHGRAEGCLGAHRAPPDPATTRGGRRSRILRSGSRPRHLLRRRRRCRSPAQRGHQDVGRYNQHRALHARNASGARQADARAPPRRSTRASALRPERELPASRAPPCA
jgi:hypothetical protein